MQTWDTKTFWRLSRVLASLGFFSTSWKFTWTDEKAGRWKIELWGDLESAATPD